MDLNADTMDRLYKLWSNNDGFSFEQHRHACQSKHTMRYLNQSLTNTTIDICGIIFNKNALHWVIHNYIAIHRLDPQDARDICSGYILCPGRVGELDSGIIQEIQYLPFVSKIHMFVCDYEDFVDSVGLGAFGSNPTTEDYHFCYIVCLFDGNVHILFAHCQPGTKRVGANEVMKRMRDAMVSDITNLCYIMEYATNKVQNAINSAPLHVALDRRRSYTSLRVMVT